MRDIIIQSKQLRKELITLLICVVLSFLANVGAVIYYKSPVSELLTSLFYVLGFAIFLYVGWLVLRLLKTGMFYLLLKR